MGAVFLVGAIIHWFLCLFGERDKRNHHEIMAVLWLIFGMVAIK